MKRFLLHINRILTDESGVTTIEILLILVVLIAAVLIFKEQIIDLVENIMDKITKQAMRV